MNRRLTFLSLLMLVALLVYVPACSMRQTYPSENAAKTALMGKNAHDVIEKLGAPDSVVSTTTFDNTSPYTEYWKYSRMTRDRTGTMRALRVYFLRGKVVGVGTEK